MVLLTCHSTAEFAVKFEPTTLNVNSGPPCVLLLGDTELTAGVGLGWTGGPEFPPPHAVSTLKDPRTATCKTNFIELLPDSRFFRPPLALRVVTRWPLWSCEGIGNCHSRRRSETCC